MEINKVYNIKIDILSPVHIGVDSSRWWKKGLDYIFDGDKVRLIDMNRILKSSNTRIDQISALMANGDTNAISNWIRSNLRDCSGQVLSSPIPHLKFDEIRTQIKNPLSGKPIIPGSSLKGAISSAIFRYMMGFDGQEFSLNQIAALRDRRNFITGFERVFGKANDGSAFMRFIKVPDIEFNSTKLINTKIYNLHNSGNRRLEGGWKRSGGRNSSTGEQYSDTGFNTVYEALMPGESALGRIIISEELFNSDEFLRIRKFSQQNEAIKALLSMKETTGLFAVINAYTLEYIYREKDFFEKYQGEHSVDIMSILNSIGEEIPYDENDNSSCVLRMSAGSGFHSVTGDWMHRNHEISDISINPRNNSTRGINDGKESAKSRKIAIWSHNREKVFSPMGFIKISII